MAKTVKRTGYIAAAVVLFCALALIAHAQTPAELYQQHQTLQQQLDTVARQLRDYVPPVVEPPPPPPSSEITPTTADPPTLLTQNYTDTVVEPLVNGQSSDYRTYSGIVALTVKGTKYAATAQSLSGVMVRFRINGQIASPALSSGSVHHFDTRGLADSSGHCISVDLIDGNLATLRAAAKRLIVNNGGTVDRKLALTGADYQSNRLNGPQCDAVTIPAGPRPDGKARPLPYTFSPPVHLRAIPPQQPVLNNTLWKVEPLVHTSSTLYVPTPQLSLTLDGLLTVGNHVNQSTDNVTDALDPQDRTAYPDGPRNIGGVSPYGQAFSKPGVKGWHRCEITGRVTTISESGEVRTIFGPKLKDGVIPLARGDAVITTRQIRAHNAENVGRLEGGALWLRGVHDCQWYDDTHILATDSFQHYLSLIDATTGTAKPFCGVPVPVNASGAKQAGAQVDGPCAQAKFHLPYGAIRGPPGPLENTVWVVDVGDTNGNQSALRKIENGTVTTVLQLTGKRAFVNRWFSDGTMLIIEQGTPSVSSRAMNYNPVTGAYTQLTTVTKANWIWASVDTKGNIGPKDDFLVASSTGGYGNVELRRYSRTGQKYGDGVEFVGNQGRASQGHMTYVADPQTHYPWDVAIHADEAKVLTSGFGTMGVNEIRLYNAGESKGAYNHILYSAGMGVIRFGTVPSFGIASRPSFTALRNQFGHTRIGIDNFDDLAGMTDAELGAYLVSGFGGSVPRPELEAEFYRKAAIAFIRHNTLGQQGVVFPPEPPKKALVMRGLRWTRAAEKITADYTTDEDTIGLLACGPNTLNLMSPFGAWGKSHAHTVDVGTAAQRLCAIQFMNRAGTLSATPATVH